MAFWFIAAQPGVSAAAALNIQQSAHQLALISV